MNKLLFITVLMVSVACQLFSQPVNDSIVDDGMIQETLNSGSICYSYIPQWFSPNRNGVFDEWCIKTRGADICILNIFTSSKPIIEDKEIELGENRTTCLWDGGTEGSGGYLYIIVLKNISTGEEIEIRGIVSIMNWNP
ncbi:MAG: hypothetical protein L3J31_02650 [Bacteroidales bacterium]|nr:hypothetical protein [Bacteroidales bacterium]MCF6341690.1 hypothetical protein [Bacteroidales bacterium]